MDWAMEQRDIVEGSQNRFFPQDPIHIEICPPEAVGAWLCPPEAVGAWPYFQHTLHFTRAGHEARNP